MRLGPKYKIARRLGRDLFEQTQTQKYMLSEARKVKNQKNSRRRRTLSDYGKQLLEKQKVRFTYGISEKQFKNIVKAAIKQKSQDATKALYEKLESRLDNTIYRLGLAPTRRMARQIVSHGHISVNGRKVNIPSFVVSKGDKVSIREGSRNKAIFLNLEEKNNKEKSSMPNWLKFDLSKREALVEALPVLKPGESLLDLNTVIEFYSK